MQPEVLKVAMRRFDVSIDLYISYRCFAREVAKPIIADGPLLHFTSILLFRSV
jgi:hypothetical protein